MREMLAAVLRRLDRRVAVFLVLLTVLCAFFSVIIPPFQSPDEFDHVKRAYLLGKGKFILDRATGKSSGGMIDNGLAEYISAYQRYISKPQLKLSADVIAPAGAIRWAGQVSYSPAPGTGFYFPAIYAPQALGLMAGKRLDLTVDASYRLARFFALATSVCLLLLAFSVYPTNPLALAFLVLPMSLFQLASASLDGVSTAVAILAISLFLRIHAEDARGTESRTIQWMFYSLIGCVLLLATSRIHLLPLTLLVLFGRLRSDRRGSWVAFALSVLATCVWLLIAIRTTVDMRVDIAAPTSKIIGFYLAHPLSFLEVLGATVSSTRNVFAYGLSFIGSLGWLDTTFSLQQYAFVAACVGLIAVLSISSVSATSERVARSLLVGLALLSMVLIFFALLVTWTPHPALEIRGVQGRYFLVPAIMVAYAISGAVDPFRGVMRKLAIGLVGVLMAFAILDMTWLLLGRYYLAPHEPVPAALAAPSGARPGP